MLPFGACGATMNTPDDAERVQRIKANGLHVSAACTAM